MAPRRTKESALEEINEVLKQGLRPMLDLAPVVNWFQDELGRVRDQLGVERGVSHGLRDNVSKLEAQLAEARSERDHAVRRLREQDQRIRELETDKIELQAQVNDPQGMRFGVGVIGHDQMRAGGR